jgi:hypothetical protein
VPLDGPPAQEKLAADLGIGAAVSSQSCNLHRGVSWRAVSTVRLRTVSPVTGSIATTITGGTPLSEAHRSPASPRSRGRTSRGHYDAAIGGGVGSFRRVPEARTPSFCCAGVDRKPYSVWVSLLTADFRVGSARHKPNFPSPAQFLTSSQLALHFGRECVPTLAP